MSLLLIDSFKSDHVGVTKYVRPKVGSYAPVDTTAISFEKANYRIRGSSRIYIA